MFTRRSFLLAGISAASVACRRPKARGFSGFAFIANQEGQAVAAVDLTVFAVARHIHVDGSPTAITSTGSRVFALTPENGYVHEISADTLGFVRKVQVAKSALTMRMSDQGLYVLCTSPRRLVRLSLPSLAQDWVAPLPADPADFDLSADGRWLAISYGQNRAIGFFDISQKRSFEPVAAGGDVGTVRFQPDSSQLLAADLSGHRLSVYKTTTRGLIVNLPLAVRPDQFCFSPLGGQLFVTGAGMDGVVVVYPYYTPEVAETVLAGHTPGAMASVSLSPPKDSPDAPDEGYLFVANAQSGDVSILDIATHKLLAVTPVGAGPGYVTITPDRQYALVLNQTSGDMAVIRIANITRTVNEQRRWKKGALFMLIPVGSKPVSATVVAI
ncbi:MAG TPA: hypothetical protein VKG25_22190 [Bryobacteraceae bacterium]|nr:hypothetical protein [Bryobacteraceae bacterium]